MSLPASFVVELAARTVVIDGGAALLGGSPTRLLRLSAKARGALRGRRIAADTAVGAVLADRLLESGLADPELGALPAFDADVTVVVPVRDRAPQLDRLLGALTAHTAPSRIVVVDDGSRQPGAIRRVVASHGVRLVTSAENRGPAAARNLGLRHVETPFVAFADSDVVLGPGAIPELLKHFHDPRVAAVAPRIIALGDGGGWVARYEAARSSLDLGPEPATVRPGSRVGWVPATCLLARVEALGSGFDESMRVGEDVDLVWRLVAAGHRVRYEPAVEVAHEHRTGLAAFVGRKFAYGSSAASLGERHPAAITPAILAPWSAAVMAALLAQRRWSVPVASVATVIAAARIARRLDGLERRGPLALRLAGRGLLAAAAQTSALLLRHWWPATALAAAGSRRARRAVLAAAVVDAAVEYVRLEPGLDPVRFGILRRIDDLAYGAGVWWSAIRARRFAALRPTIRS